MPKGGADGTTIRPRPVRPRRSSVPAPWLTILWHPEHERIGDVAPLPAKLSRLEPELGPPGHAPRAPLGDPHLSRKQISLAYARGALTITADEAAELVVDGNRVAGRVTIDANALARGVVLELGERVALLVHLRRTPRTLPAGALVGASDALATLHDVIARVASHAAPVLITGETGVGKELVARAVHEQSARAKAPFVAINMATLTSGVAAGQLFGHERGAFTGAERAHAGFFEQADGGTLFLDEVGDAPADIQAMLLRVLETGEIQPLGANASRRVDVRVVAATDADLDAEVASGEFRGQLYHRLAGHRIAVPPLRDRIDDLGRLLVAFLAREGVRPPLPAPGEPPWLPSAALLAYARHPWPGNVRELANVARHLAILGRDGSIGLTDAIAPLGRIPSSPGGRGINDDDLVAALAAQRWRIGATATALGVSRTTLYALIDRCPRIRKARDVSPDEIARCREEAAGDLDAMAERLQVSKRGLQLRMRELGLA